MVWVEVNDGRSRVGVVAIRSQIARASTGRRQAASVAS
jgi:hypothetical protein